MFSSIKLSSKSDPMHRLDKFWQKKRDHGAYEANFDLITFFHMVYPKISYRYTWFKKYVVNLSRILNKFATMASWAPSSWDSCRYFDGLKKNMQKTVNLHVNLICQERKAAYCIVFEIRIVTSSLLLSIKFK